MKEEKYLSKEFTNSIRGILAIAVVIHHIYMATEVFRKTFLGGILLLVGYLSVATFFFFSGYGLIFSAKKKNYINTFFTKRFLPLYCFYVVLILLYTIWFYLLNGTFSLKNFLLSFGFGTTIVANGWYLQTTFITYLLFLLVFKIFKSNKHRFLAFALGVFIYSLICFILNLGIHLYQTVPCMVLGMLFCIKKDTIDKLLKKYSLLLFVVSGLLFVGCVGLYKITNIPVIFNVLYSIFFVLALIPLLYIFSEAKIIKNKVTTFLGNYSLEIYVTHGFFISLLRFFDNVYLYIFVVFLGTILSSLLTKKLYNLTTNFIKNLTIKKDA